MTLAVRGELLGQAVTRWVEGPPERIRNVLANHVRQGTLLAHGPVKLLPGGKVGVEVRLIEDVSKLDTRWSTARVAWTGFGVSAGLGVGVGVAWGVAMGVAWLLAHLLPVLVVVALLALVGGGGCTTIVKVTHWH